MYQYFDKPKELDESIVKNIEGYLEKTTKDFFKNIESSVFIGSSGSFKTFYELYSNKQYPRNEYVDKRKSRRRPPGSPRNEYLDKYKAFGARQTAPAMSILISRKQPEAAKQPQKWPFW